MIAAMVIIGLYGLLCVGFGIWEIIKVHRRTE